MSKYYAVRNGRKTGIFDNWNECRESVEGFSSAEYKSFVGLEEAKSYLKNYNKEDSNKISHKNTKNLKTVKAYVDGSYSKNLGKYAYGCVLIDKNNITKLSGAGTSKKGSNLWNVSGELRGAVKAIEWSIDNKFEGITIYYDYEGIEKWANGEWKSKKDETKEYVEFINKHQKIINIDFVKVKAHSGDKYNEEADKLAKAALTDKATSEMQKNKLEEEMYIIFREAVKIKSKTKNQISFNYNGYQITEGNLRRFIKEFWKKQGNKINQIESYKVNFDSASGLLAWEYLTRDGDKLNFKFNVKWGR